MSVDPGNFGLSGFAFPVVSGGVACDYPAVSDVRTGTVYGFGGYTGTLYLPGTSGESTGGTHSPADIIRCLLVVLGHADDPRVGGHWPAYVNTEPQTPDNAITVYDTVGKEDGRSMIDGEAWSHYGIQVRVRAATERVGWPKALDLRRVMTEEIHLQHVTIDDATYLVWSLANVGQVNALGTVESASKRKVWTINALASIRRTA